MDAGAEHRHDADVSRSARRLEVLILRDPLNLFASRLASGIGDVSEQTAVRVWMQHARAFIGDRRTWGSTA